MSSATPLQLPTDIALHADHADAVDDTFPQPVEASHGVLGRSAAGFDAQKPLVNLCARPQLSHCSSGVARAAPRRALITDDMQSVIIDLSKHKDSQVPDGEWPVLKQEDLKPTFEPYAPDKSEEPYWPHLPLSEEPTYYQRIRRITWVTGCFMLITTVFTTIITFIYPDEAGYPDVAIFFAVVSGVCFVIAYSEQLFIGGDH